MGRKSPPSPKSPLKKLLMMPPMMPILSVSRLINTIIDATIILSLIHILKNEKIKNKAERIRQQEELEAERQAKKAQRRRRMNREDFNIEVDVYKRQVTE